MSKLYAILTTAFLTMWFVSFCVELYDIYLLIDLSSTISEFEMNPVGRFLISLDGGKVGLFVVAKIVFVGMLLACLPLLYRKKPKLALTLMSILCASRIAVFSYLMWGEGDASTFQRVKMML